jgi:hypothetical protein
VQGDCAAPAATTFRCVKINLKCASLQLDPLCADCCLLCCAGLKEATVLSQASIAAVSLASIAFNLRKRHPLYPDAKMLIDYEMCLTMTPALVSTWRLATVSCFGGGCAIVDGCWVLQVNGNLCVTGGW